MPENEPIVHVDPDQMRSVFSRILNRYGFTEEKLTGVQRFFLINSLEGGIFSWR